MKYRLSIYADFDGCRERIYHELGDDKDRLLDVVNAYTSDDSFNKKLIAMYASDTIVISLEEMNEDGSWTLCLEYVDFL